MSVELIPIVTALRRNKGGALLIALQVALTVAIVSNSLSIIEQQLQQMMRPSGVDEANIVTIRNQWVGDPPDLAARVRGDLAALRALPSVVDAIATNSFPLRGYGLNASVLLTASQRRPTVNRVAIYMVDEHGLHALGLRLVAGRWFEPGEVRELRRGAIGREFGSTAVVSLALARALFPGGDALGRSIYFPDSSGPTTIIGIVAQAQTPWAAANVATLSSDRSVFLPNLYVSGTLAYVVRARLGRLDDVVRSAQSALLARSRERVLDEIQTYAEMRSEMYRPDRGLALTLGGLSLLLMGVTGSGIVSLASNWVVRRRWQIGIRRALGARRLDILRYFHTENLLIVGAGLVVGAIAAVGLNLWIVSRLEVARMEIGFVCLAAVVVMLVSQLAVLWPALRAASVPPAVAARSV